MLLLSLLSVIYYASSSSAQKSNETILPDCVDKAGWCSKMPPSDCYVNNDVCCRTCTLLKTSEPDCEFGDHASWCPDLHPSICYRRYEKETCCHTCRQAMTGPQGCEYGDRVSWCNDEDHKDVCDKMEKMLCCRTCKGKGSFSLNTLWQRWKDRKP